MAAIVVDSVSKKKMKMINIIRISFWKGINIKKRKKRSTSKKKIVIPDRDESDKSDDESIE